MSNTNVKFDGRIRPADLEDKEFILSLVPRLTEFGPPDWRDVSQMNTVDVQVLEDKIIDQPPETAIFIAEDEKGAALGFVHLQTGTDYYNREKHGHIADIIVAPEGVGRALMEKGEEWARAGISLADLERIRAKSSGARTLQAARLWRRHYEICQRTELTAQESPLSKSFKSIAD